MKNKKTLALFLASILVFLGVSKIYAQQVFPTITIACEYRNGFLLSFDDGFSALKRCPQGSRRVVLIGAPGPKGDNGEKGDPGPQGQKGDKGDPGFIPDKVIDVCFHVDTAALTVMKGGACFPHVHWRIPVQCVSGKPCQPDNPNDPFFDPPR